MIHLHIGRHKTGTTALQRFLRANRGELAARGFDYLVSATAEGPLHDAAHALNPKWLASASPAQLDSAASQTRTITGQLGREGDAIVSSEAFQNAPPEAVAGVFPAGRTRIVVYLREQLDYLLSAYAQLIQAQATHQGFVAYVNSLLGRLDYADFLDRWTAAFGDGWVLPRVYAREALEGGDVRTDFISLLGIEAAGLKFPKGAANPSIGPALIEAKGLINFYVPKDVQRRLGLHSLFGEIASAMPGRLRADDEFARCVRQRFLQSNARLFERYAPSGLSGFAVVDPVEPPDLVDRAAALERTLDILTTLSPEAGREIRSCLPARPDLGAVPALLPEDWTAATRALG